MTQVYDELYLNIPQTTTRSADPGCRTSTLPPRDSQPNALPATRTLAHPLLYALPLPERARHTAPADRLEQTSETENPVGWRRAGLAARSSSHVTARPRVS
jgi:hypothetical protein